MEIHSFLLIKITLIAYLSWKNSKVALKTIKMRNLLLLILIY